jgi:hypothetical protein
VDGRAGAIRRGRSRAFCARLRDELIAYAERECELAALQEDGNTLRVHLEAIAHKDAQAAAQLAMPRLTRYAAHVYRVYERLAAFKGSSGFGMGPLLPSEIEGWQRLFHLQLPAMVLELLFDIDRTFRHANAAQLERLRPPRGGQPARVDEA